MELGSWKWLKGNPVNAGAIPVAVSLSLLATNCKKSTEVIWEGCNLKEQARRPA